MDPGAAYRRPEPLRIVFMGTPAFAVPSLEALLAAGHEVALVVSGPSRRAGRGLRESQPPVVQLATRRGLPLFQPDRVRTLESVASIAQLKPAVIVVAAYGQILPPTLLAIPPLGCVNIHPSLLPRHRGAAPISGALLAGDTETGVSLMLMDAGMDTGPLLSRRRAPIGDQDDQVSLSARLSLLGAELLVDALPGWAAGAIRPEPQDPELATVTRPTHRSDGILDWHQPARDLWLRVRAFAEWPQGYTWWQGKLLRIARASYDPTLVDVEPGFVQAWGPRSRTPVAAAIGTGVGVLLPETVQLEGARPMSVAAFLRGHSSWVGSMLESHPPA